MLSAFVTEQTLSSAWVKSGTPSVVSMLTVVTRGPFRSLAVTCEDRAPVNGESLRCMKVGPQLAGRYRPPPRSQMEEAERIERRDRVMREGGEFDEDDDGHPELIVSIEAAGTTTTKFFHDAALIYVSVYSAQGNESLVQEYDSGSGRLKWQRRHEMINGVPAKVSERDTDADGEFDHREIVSYDSKASRMQRRRIVAEERDKSGAWWKVSESFDSGIDF